MSAPVVLSAAAHDGPFSDVGLDAPVLRADPRDHVEVPPESRVPVLLAFVAASCLVAGLAGHQLWKPASEAVAARPQASARPAVREIPPRAAVQAAAAALPARAAPPRVASAPARRTVQEARAIVRHAAARFRAPHTGRLHAGRRNGEGRA